MTPGVPLHGDRPVGHHSHSDDWLCSVYLDRVVLQERSVSHIMVGLSGALMCKLQATDSNACLLQAN